MTQLKLVKLDSTHEAPEARCLGDWSHLTAVELVEVYTSRVQARFDRPIRGGAIFKGCINRELQAIDSYGRGNFHNSVHQYKGPKGWWNSPMPFGADLVAIERYLKSMSGETVRFGLKSDPFMWLDCKFNFTKKVLQLATRYGVRLAIHTMSDLCGHDDYLELIEEGGHTVRMQLGVGEGLDLLERRLSPGAPSVKRRLTAVYRLRDAGVSVATDQLSEPETWTLVRDLIK